MMPIRAALVSQLMMIALAMKGGRATIWRTSINVWVSSIVVVKLDTVFLSFKEICVGNGKVRCFSMMSDFSSLINARSSKRRRSTSFSDGSWMLPPSLEKW